MRLKVLEVLSNYRWILDNSPQLRRLIVKQLRKGHAYPDAAYSDAHEGLLLKSAAWQMEPPVIFAVVAKKIDEYPAAGIIHSGTASSSPSLPMTYAGIDFLLREMLRFKNYLEPFDATKQLDRASAWLQTRRKHQEINQNFDDHYQAPIGPVDCRYVLYRQHS